MDGEKGQPPLSISEAARRLGVSDQAPRGFHDASRDPQLINRWWGQTWPDAWIGMPTGKISRRWVLDIDVKRAAENGWDSLEDLGHLPLPGLGRTT